MSDATDLRSVVNDLVGRPWSAAGFTCWDFVSLVYQRAYAIELPPLVMDAQDPRSTMPVTAREILSGRWHRFLTPGDGDVVAMGRRGRPHHCGVWIEHAGGLVAHCDAPAGVAVAPLRSLIFAGWGSFRYYRHTGRLL